MTNATEDTLQELLEESKRMSAHLGTIASSPIITSPAGGGGGSGGGGSGGIDWTTFIRTLGPAGVALTVLSTAVGGVTFALGFMVGAVNGIVGSMNKFVGGFEDFTTMLTKGNLQVSEFFGELQKLTAQIPIIGGLLSLLITPLRMAVARQEESLDMFRKMSTVGAGVNVDLDVLRHNARATGLSMEEYSNSIVKNSQIFAIAGGSVDDGAKMFAKNMTALMGPRSDVSRALFGMGYTAQNASDMLALFIDGQGTINKKGLQNTETVKQGVVELAQQMTFLSEITGKQREQLEKDLKEAQQEANWKSFLANLSPEDAKRASQAVAFGLAKAGKDGADAVKLAISTGITTPITEGGKRLFLSTNGMSEQWLKAVSNIKAPQDKYIEGVAKSTVAMGKGTAAMNGMMGSVSMINTVLGKNFMTQDALNNATQTRGKSEKQLAEEYKKMFSDMKHAGSDSAAGMAQMTQNLRQFGNRVDDFMGKILAPFFGVTAKVMDSLEGLGDHLIKVIQPMAVKFSTWLSDWIGKFASVKNWDDFKHTFHAFFIDVGNQMKPILKTLWEDVKPYLKEGINKLMDYILDYLRVKLPFGKTILGKTTAEQQKAKEDQLKVFNSQIAEWERKKKNAPESSLLFNTKADYEKTLVDLRKRRDALQHELHPAQAKPQPVQKPVTTPVKTASQNARDWAYSLMIGKTTMDKVPAKFKAEVQRDMSDKTLRKQADAFLAQQRRQKQEADHAAKQAKLDQENAKKREAEQSRKEKEDLAKQGYEIGGGSDQTDKADDTEITHRLLSQLVTYTKLTADATTKTAKSVSRSGNLFQS